MQRFRFWASIIFPITLGLIGLYIASFVPIEDYGEKELLQILYALLGVLIGIITFSRLTSWLVRTTTRLIRSFINKLATEMINQFGQTILERSPFLNLRGLGGSEIDRLDGSIRKSLKQKRVLILDTSSIIDGRILDVVKTGFIEGTVVLPGFVLKELQMVADSSDSQKRARGRKGFEVVEELKKLEGIKLITLNKDTKNPEVDEKLVNLAKSLKARILTCDYNLNKRASLSGLSVLNINELSNALKTVILPGERFEVKLVQKGKDKEQGVGYLEDGTMVVVEEASHVLNKSVKVEATKMLQNPAGKIIFGRLAG